MRSEHDWLIPVTTSCRDCDYISKVPDAGKVIQPTAGKPYQVMHNGLKIMTESSFGEWVNEIIKGLKGHHEPQEEKVFYEILKEMPPNAVMIELGSLWAYYSMWFNKNIPNARNYMIEPIEKYVSFGRENFRQNNMRGTFIQACIGKDSKAEVELLHWDHQYYKVRQLSVDDLSEQQNISYVDILHADIQGAEYAMLLGCQKSIKANKIRYIFISTHSERLHYHCLDFLRKHRFHIIAEHSLLQSYSVDGLIVAAANDKDNIPIAVSKRKRSLVDNCRALKTRLRVQLELMFRVEPGANDY